MADLYTRLLTKVERHCCYQLGKRGYKVKQRPPLVLCKDSLEPRTHLLKETTTLFQPIVLTIPVKRLRSVLGADFSHQNPFVGTLLQSEKPINATALYQHFKNFQPENAAQALGVNENEVPGFRNLPALAFLMPWQDDDPKEFIEIRKKFMEQQAKQHGLLLEAEDGFNHFGPASPEKIKLELDRLNHLYRSLLIHGFIRNNKHDGDITGCLMTQSDGKWCVQVKGGQHRAAAAAALNYESVPVRICHSPIKREEVLYWPQVKIGRMTQAGALHIFDRIMKGACPSKKACQSTKLPSPIYKKKPNDDRDFTSAT